MASPKPKLICAVRGSLHGGRAICGSVGCGEPWKCWREGECEHQVKPESPKPKEAGDE